MKHFFNHSIVKRFIKNFSWLFSFNVLGYLFSLIAFPILIHKYGLEDIGAIFTVQALVLGMASIANYGFVYFIPTVSGKVATNQEYYVKLWNLVLYTRTLLSLILTLLSIAIVLFYYPQFAMLWLLSLPLLIPKVINPTLFCNALEANQYVFKIGFLSKVLFLVLIIVSNQSVFINFFFAISELLAILIYLKKIHIGFFRIQLLGFRELKQFLKETFNLFLVNLFSLLKPHSVLPIISVVLGNAFVTLFAIAEKVINPIKGVSGIMFVSYFPIYTKEKFGIWPFSIKTLVYIIILSILSVTCFWYLSPSIIYYLNDFNINLLAVATLQILSLSIPIFFLMIPLFSYALDHKKWNAILYFALIQLVVLAGLLYFLIDENIVGVAKSLVISEYFMFLCYVVYVFKKNPLKISNSNT